MDKPKYFEYTTIILEAVGEKIEEYGLDLEEMDMNQFIHAFATIAPCMFYQNITGEKTDNLGFNHIANRLCFQYSNNKNPEKKEEE